LLSATFRSFYSYYAMACAVFKAASAWFLAASRLVFLSSEFTAASTVFKASIAVSITASSASYELYTSLTFSRAASAETDAAFAAEAREAIAS